MHGNAQCSTVAGIGVVVALMAVSFTLRCYAKQGDPNATGKITSVDNTSSQINVNGTVRNGSLWLGVTFFPGTEKECDLEAVQKNKRLIFCTGSFSEMFTVPYTLPSLSEVFNLRQDDKSWPYTVALWRFYVPRNECTSGDGGGPCDYCINKGYHLEDCVDRVRGTWTRTSGGVTTPRAELERNQRDAEEAERQARVDAERRQQEAERQARVEAERRQREAERQARIDAERRRQEAERQARIEEERRRQEAERQAEMAERRRREQEQAERQARIEEERRRLEAGRQAEIVAERKRREQEQAERGSREVNIGINARTVTPREMGERRLISNCNLVEVTSVDPGSPAARAGIRPGMIIRSFGGRVPHEPSDIPDRGKTGDTFNVDVIGQSPLIIQIMDHD